MKTRIKTIFAILAALSLAPAPALAALDIQFEADPLFSSVNFLPGDAVTRRVRAVNPDQDSYLLAAKVANPVDPDGLANRIEFKIVRQGGPAVFEGTLKGLFDQGLAILGEIAPGEAQDYDFQAVFKPESGNEYQRRRVGFDIIIQSEGQGVVTAAGGGGGGGPLFLGRSEPAPVVKGLDYAFPDDLDEPAAPLAEEENPIVLGIDNIKEALAKTGFSPAELGLLLLALALVLVLRWRIKKSLVRP